MIGGTKRHLALGTKCRVKWAAGKSACFSGPTLHLLDQGSRWMGFSLWTKSHGPGAGKSACFSGHALHLLDQGRGVFHCGRRATDQAATSIFFGGQALFLFTKYIYMVMVSAGCGVRLSFHHSLY